MDETLFIMVLLLVDMVDLKQQRIMGSHKLWVKIIKLWGFFRSFPQVEDAQVIAILRQDVTQ